MYETFSHIRQSQWSALSLLSSCYCYFHILDIKESIRQLTLLIWAHLVVMTIILTLIAIILMLWKLISYKRRRKISRHVKQLSQVVCDKGMSLLSQYTNSFQPAFKFDVFYGRGGVLASWSVRMSPDRTVRRARSNPGGEPIVLCSWQRQFNLTVPLSTQEHKFCNGKLNTGVTLRWNSILSRGE